MQKTKSVILGLLLVTAGFVGGIALTSSGDSTGPAARPLAAPVALAAGPARADFEALARQPDEWSLLYFTAGPCDQQCAAQLELAGTIRALIGAQGKQPLRFRRDPLRNSVGAAVG